MTEDKDYASLRIKAATNNKLKVLSGLLELPSITVVEQLVDAEYAKRISEAAKDVDGS